MAINFDFRSGAKKSGHLDYPLQSYGPKQVRLISTQPPYFLKQLILTNRLKMRFFKMEKRYFLIRTPVTFFKNCMKWLGYMYIKIF